MYDEWLAPTALVRDILQRVPGAPRAFEQHRVDYCCHGELPLAEACDRVSAALHAVLASLAQESARPDAEPAWGDSYDHMPLGDLVALLADEVHPQALRDVAGLRALCPAQGALGAAVRRLCDELEPHLAFEERHLFPYITAMEERGRTPPALFDSVVDPCRMLLAEHEAADRLLDEVRALTDGYAPPDEACAPLYRALADYDRALVRHMHIEGNALFPRARRLEEKLRAVAAGGRAPPSSHRRPALVTPRRTR